MGRPNLFVVVSTGQPVANLPPVLENAVPGDFVYWIESRDARQKKWTARPRELLEEFGLVTAGTLQVANINDPASLSAALKEFVDSAIGQYDRIFYVANGGTKLTPVGVLLGLQPLAPELLYGEEAPAQYVHYPSSFTDAPHIRQYEWHGLDLPEIMRVKGYTVSPGKPGVKIWPTVPPVEILSERYGTDEPHTYDLHDTHHVRAGIKPGEESPPYEMLPTLVRGQFNGWQDYMLNFRRREAIHPELFKTVYKQTLSLDRKARQEIAAKGVSKAAAPLGPSLENAVAARVHRWLNQTQHPAVKSAWFNVVVARMQTQDVHDIEFDILLVLRNGILIHLECKSADVDVRDLDARLYRLREASSSLAELVIVLPLFTQQGAKPWCQSLQSAQATLASRGWKVIPFTIPGQPTRFTEALEAGSESTECPSFEDSLENVLSRYRPG